MLQPFAVGIGDPAGIDEVDVGFVEFAAQLRPARLLVAGEAGAGVADGAELAAQRAPVVGHHGDALALLALEAGDAHHEEFVEIVGRDRQEAQLLEQRMVVVLRLLQHPAIELQPGQLAVDEARLRLAQLHAGGDLGIEGCGVFGGGLRVLLVHRAKTGVSRETILLAGNYDDSDKIGRILANRASRLSSPARAHGARR